MIYTIGHTENYRKYLSEYESPKKLGPRENYEYYNENGKLIIEPYEGGIAFETPIDASLYILENNFPYSVFSLDGNWNSDVKYDNENKFYRITKDLLIIEEVMF
jgi:hypothetical protein